MLTREKDDVGLGTKALRALSHPIRIAIQCILYNRIASPNQMAQELGEDLSNVSYHVKILSGGCCIDKVSEQPKRGAVEHFYRATVPPLHDDASWAKLSKPNREEISAITFQGLVAEAAFALDQGTFDARKDRHLSRVPMDLDDQGWRDLINHQAAWLKKVEQIKAEAADRVGAGKPGKPCLAVMIGIEVPAT